VSPTFWKGYSNRERHAEISNISNIISLFGDIVDFKLFSDVSISITMEVSAQNAGALLEALQDCIDSRGNSLAGSIGAGNHHLSQLNVLCSYRKSKNRSTASAGVNND
jgi:hypothetical protein